MINVLIVDDDAMIAELNKTYINQVKGGFTCIGIARTLAEAESMISEYAQKIDLVLLDIYLHRDNGLSLLPLIRESRQDIDVIVISSASDTATIQSAMYYGIVDYLIKPFKFTRFEEALNNWREKKKFIRTQQNYGQLDVDKLLHFGSGECVNTRILPKGITPETLRIIAIWVDSCSDEEFSTDDVVSGTSLSRVSCRKYLNWLVKINVLSSSIQYGVTGRPAYSYRLRPEFLELLKSFCQ